MKALVASRRGALALLALPIALAVLTVDLRLRPSDAGPAGPAVELGVGVRAAAFDPVTFVWNKFRTAVLDKVKGLLSAPVDKAKAALKALIDKAGQAMKDLFVKHVLTPALRWAMEKIFPGLERVLQEASTIIGKVDTWVQTAERYTAAVDALIVGKAQKFSAVIGEVNSSMDVIQKLNVTMVVDVLLAMAKEKVDAFIRSKAIELLNKAYSLVEAPINAGKAAACSALGSIPVVGGLIRGAADFVITQGLALLRDKGFAFIADEAVKLADKVLALIGQKLRGLAAKVDVAIAPILDALKGHIAKVASYVEPVRAAYARVKAGLTRAQEALAKAKTAANP